MKMTLADRQDIMQREQQRQDYRVLVADLDNIRKRLSATEGLAARCGYPGNMNLLAGAISDMIAHIKANCYMGRGRYSI